MYVHQLVMCAKLGRPLGAGETVERLDGNTLNNAPENLEIVSAAENTRRMHRRRSGA
jgi:hypothetical protein